MYSGAGALFTFHDSEELLREGQYHEVQGAAIKLVHQGGGSVDPGKVEMDRDHKHRCRNHGG